jgi:type III restriction enzyme
LLNDPYEIEKRQIGELRALKSQGRCLFGQIAMQRDGVGMSGQLDVLLA